MWNETPPHGGNLTNWFLRMLGVDRGELGRRDIDPRSPILFPRCAVKVLLDNLLSPRKSVATAHEGIMADRQSIILEAVEHPQGRVERGATKTKTPQTHESWGVREQPSPEVCSQVP